MPEVIKKDLAWYPPPFPPQGRLPDSAALVGSHCKKQNSQELAYRQELCLSAGRRVEPPCCKTLHISLFFDGTGNNLNHDLYIADPKHPTNIARLFRATIGSGYAGGAGQEQSALFDASEPGADNYFKFYMPGVGTPFPEINDLDFSVTGLAGAHRGEERINWALLRIIDVLKFVLKEQWMSNGESRKAIDNMATTWLRLGLGGSHNRYEEFTRQLRALKPLLKPALAQPEPGKPKLLGIKLYVYGFSRGAAAARSFVRWLSELLPLPDSENAKPEQCLAVDDVKIPISVEFLGLLDTVASVGIAHIAPFAEGHMAWADNMMELPDEATYGGLIKRCVHLVASHEQRLCFPLDSIRRGDGRYPANSVEVIYPGVHSDIGGGYPPGDQGKANGPDDSRLLSQIILNDLYAEAFKVGAPLKVPEGSLSEVLTGDSWRKMPLDVLDEFLVHTELVQRFNAWREVTLKQTTPADFTPQQAADYSPVRAAVSLESAIDQQMAWITGWRIERYEQETFLKARFYQEATNRDGEPGQLARSKEDRDTKQKQRETERIILELKASRKEQKDLVLPPGVKDFDPDLNQRQLWEAAREFREDYRGQFRTQNEIHQVVLDNLIGRTIFLINTDDEPAEYQKMKTEGDQKRLRLFRYSLDTLDASEPPGLVRALFDDQVHDSRAWFLYYALGTREPWGGYFRYRMIFFGDKSSKSVAPVVIDGDVVGAAGAVTGIVVNLIEKQPTENMTVSAEQQKLAWFDVEIRDRDTHQPIALLSGTERQQQFTHTPGTVVAQHKTLAGEQHLMIAKSGLPSDKTDKVLTASA